MSYLTQDMATWLAGKVAGWTTGTNLFAGHFPEDAPDTAAVLLERTGAAIEPHDPDFQERRIQLWVRAPTQFSAEGAAWTLFDGLVSAATFAVTMGGHTILTVSGISPALVGRDSRGRFEYSANLTVRLRAT
jgi:hypothetical protein